MKKIILLLVLFVLIGGSSAMASTLNLGADVYRFQMTNFHSGEGDFIQVDLGYGRDKFTGYGISVIAPYNQDGKEAIAELEYQFIPQSRRDNSQNFNYAFKLGGVSGTFVDSSKSGLKAGFIIERAIEDKLMYLDLDMVAGSDTIFDGELGLCGEIAEGILGVIGFKVAASNDENFGTATGVTYGIKIDF